MGKPLACDFCGKATERVRRVALERGYDRLVPRHAVRYACAECSEAKDRTRHPTPPRPASAPDPK